MNGSTGSNKLLRLGEWVVAVIGAANCVIVPFLFIQSVNGNDLFPALYFLEITLIGVLVLVLVAARPRLGGTWLALPWVAVGILLTFVVLGGFSIGPYLIPGTIAFLAVGVLADMQTGGLSARHLGIMLVAAVIQGTFMIAMALLA